MELPLEEWEPRSLCGQELSGAAGLPLEALAGRLEPLVACQPEWGGRVRLCARGRVGEIAVGDLRVEVRPRLPVGELVALLAKTAGAPLELLEAVIGACAGRKTGLAEALALGLVREAERILAGDLDRQERRREERLQMLRGRPLFDRLGAGPPALGVPCRYVEATRDTALNRLVAAGLEAATRRLARWQAWRRRAMAVAVMLQELARPAWPSREDFVLARSRITPRTERYRVALQLAEWLLLGGGPLSSCGGRGASGWRLDMASLFERAVAQALAREARAAGFQVRAQEQHRLRITDAAGASYRAVRPDLEIRGGGRTLAIVDAKYKEYALTKEDGSPHRRVSSEDLYQLAFYGAELAPEAALAIVAPADPDGAPLGAPWRTIHLAGRRLAVIGIDLRALSAGRASIWSAILEAMRACGPAPAS